MKTSHRDAVEIAAPGTEWGLNFETWSKQIQTKHIHVRDI